VNPVLPEAAAIILPFAAAAVVGFVTVPVTTIVTAVQGLEGFTTTNVEVPVQPFEFLAMIVYEPAARPVKLEED